MSKEPQVFRVDDDEHGHIHAGWSRSGRRLIVSVWSPTATAQVTLTHEQVAALARFLEEGGPQA